MMSSDYLTVRDHCPVCGEALHHQRADDAPAHLAILIVGPLVALALMFIDSRVDPRPLLKTVLVSVLISALSPYLLPRLKRAMVALQWAKRMHGSGPSPDV